MNTKIYSAPLCKVRKLLARRDILADCDCVLHSADGYENGHAYVDLGLPSGLKWATMNVGASCVTEYGEYYEWGETNCNDWDYYNKEEMAFIILGLMAPKKHAAKNKYNISTLDLNSENDAATRNWGGAWRMPTDADFEELINNCYWVWTSNYNGSGIAGYIVYAAKSSFEKGSYIPEFDTPLSKYSLSDHHIFLPAAGYFGDRVVDAGETGRYWSSSRDYDDKSIAWGIFFDSIRRRCLDYDQQSFHSVRAVCEL